MTNSPSVRRVGEVVEGRRRREVPLLEPGGVDVDADVAVVDGSQPLAVVAGQDVVAGPVGQLDVEAVEHALLERPRGERVVDAEGDVAGGVVAGDGEPGGQCAGVTAAADLEPVAGLLLELPEQRLRQRERLVGDEHDLGGRAALVGRVGRGPAHQAAAREPQQHRERESSEQGGPKALHRCDSLRRCEPDQVRRVCGSPHSQPAPRAPLSVRRNPTRRRVSGPGDQDVLEVEGLEVGVAGVEPGHPAAAEPRDRGAVRLRDGRLRDAEPAGARHVSSWCRWPCAHGETGRSEVGTLHRRRPRQ